jgi:hypothetical protein
MILILIGMAIYHEMPIDQAFGHYGFSSGQMSCS